MNFLRTLAVLAVLLSPVVARGDPILVSGADVNARLVIFNNDEIIPIDDGDWLVSFVEGSYEDLAPLLQEQVWWGDVSQTRADIAIFVGIAFAELVGEVPGVNNLGLGLGPMFLAENYLEQNLHWASWSNGYRFPVGATIYAGAWQSRILVYATAELVSVPESVTIDVKPGSDPNCFNVNGHGVIPVAVLGSDSFDVVDVDVATLSFGGLAVRMRGNKGPICGYEDSNGDGIQDLVCQFQDDPSAWDVGSDTATLSGELLDGSPFEGSDSICVAP